jgi:hypothetical protein
MDNLNILVTGLHVKNNNTLLTDTSAVYNHNVLISSAVVAVVDTSYALVVWSSIRSTLSVLYGLEPAEFLLMLRERETEKVGGQETIFFLILKVPK